MQPDFVSEELLRELSDSFRAAQPVSRPELFTRFRIKRGLRNADGTGVLVGASHLGNVHGYILNEGEREPIEGRLTYRGYNVYDLIHGLEQEDRFGFEEVGLPADVRRAAQPPPACRSSSTRSGWSAPCRTTSPRI